MLFFSQEGILVHYKSSFYKQFIFNNKFGDFNVGGFNSSYINLIKVISKFLNKKAVIFRKKRTTPKINKIFLKTKIMRADPSLKFTSLAETLKDLKSGRDENYNL